MNKYLLIFIGSGFGGMLRFWISTTMTYLLGKHFPIGTLVVNVSGSFLMGLLFFIIFERLNAHVEILFPLLLVGVLGGYTTFSAFSIETFNLIQDGAFIAAGINILCSVILCLFATWLGITLGRIIPL